MRKRIKENILAFSFLISILGIAFLQDKRIFFPEVKYPQRVRGKKIALYLNEASKTDFVTTEYTPIISAEEETKYYAIEKDDAMKNELEESGIEDDKPNEQDLSNLGKLAIPQTFDNFADLVDPVHMDVGKYEIPFFWHIARAGGSTVKDIMGSCLDLVAASDLGGSTTNLVDDEVLKVKRIDGGKYVNVDFTSVNGIERGKELRVLESGIVEVVVSPRFPEASTLFTQTNKARAFVMLRDPVDRAISLFYYLNYGRKGISYDPEVMMNELETYARTDRMENNWMVRSLVNKMEGYLTVYDLDVAKEILRRKVLIGLLAEKEVSMKRFEQYFGWDKKAKIPGAGECEERLLGWGWSKKQLHPQLDEYSIIYQILRTKNEFDMHLYDYAKLLFIEQGIILDLESPKTLSTSYVKKGERRL